MPSRLPMEPAPDPAVSLEHALLAYVSIPVRGYQPIEIVGDWARYRYVVDGRLKAVAVLTDRFDGYPEVKGWDLAGLRACDGSEMRQVDLPGHGLTIWRDRLDQPVVTTTISSIPGPGHCGWESTIFLWYRGEQFFRDPRHVLRGSTVVSFDPTVHLPHDASDTGLHTDRWHLFEIPSGRAVFIRTASGSVERWPHAKQEVGCA